MLRKVLIMESLEMRGSSTVDHISTQEKEVHPELIFMNFNDYTFIVLNLL